MSDLEDTTEIPDNSSGNWYRSYRKIKQWCWYKDVPTCHLFRHMLDICNFKESTFLGEKLLPGEFAATFRSLSAGSGLTFKQVRRGTLNLKKTQEIVQRRASCGARHYTIYSITNWQLYQPPSNGAGHTTGHKKGTQPYLPGHAEGTIPRRNKNKISKSEIPADHFKGPKGLFHAPQKTIDSMLTEFGQEWLTYWITEFESFCGDGAKGKKWYREHTDYAAAIRNWDRRKAEKGLTFSPAGPAGPGYYTTYAIKDFYGGNHHD